MADPSLEDLRKLMETAKGREALKNILEMETTVDSDTDYSIGVQDQTDAEEGLAIADVGASSPTSGPLGQISDLELEQLRAASPTGGEPSQIGASPDNLGATRGLLPEDSGIDTARENKRRMMLMLRGIR